PRISVPQRDWQDSLVGVVSPLLKEKTMVGQEAHGWWAYADNASQTWEMTVQVNKRDTTSSRASKCSTRQPPSVSIRTSHIGWIRKLGDWSSSCAANRRLRRKGQQGSKKPSGSSFDASRRSK